MKLFVDTSAWVAYYDVSDRWHAAAREAMTSLLNQRVTFVTTDYVLDETITLLLYHAGHEQALTFGDAVQRSRHVKLIWIDANTWERAWRLFKQYDDKAWAFTDCTSFTIMREVGLRQAFASDHHFEQAGFPSLFSVRSQPRGDARDNQRRWCGPGHRRPNREGKPLAVPGG